ncbi:MAG: SpoIVB peptidase S55 domain-containing protein [Gammaproteobacteria bacterium]
MNHPRSLRCLGCAPLAAALLLAFPAEAAPPVPPLPECAELVTPETLSPGQQAIGFTVREGEQVEAFSAEILGVDRGALGPGKDLIVVDTSGPVIDEGGGGISVGMSGSPVYTEDGKLIGAIAYGFSVGPSSIGGVTPAPDMLQVFAEGAAPAAEQGAAVARLAPGSRARIARAQGVAPSSVAEEMGRLKVPVSVSGNPRPEQLSALRDALTGAGAGVIVSRGASATVPLGPPSARLAPGDAIGAALSFGDVTMAATGTTTYVCGDKAVAFGHPLLFTGPAVMGATRARVLRIVADPTFVPFKYATLTEPVGIVDRDRFSAIRARFGAEIPTIPVTQDTTALDTGNQRLGARTDVVGPTGSALGRFLFAQIAILHSFTNIAQTFDQISGGSAGISWTISGVRTGSGQPFALASANRWTSPDDISFAATDELFVALDQLAFQDFEPIEFTGLAVDDVSVERTVRRYRIERVLWARNGRRFADVERLRVRRGDTVRARVELRALDDGSQRTESMRFPVPGGRQRGAIQIVGGATLASEEAGAVVEDGEGEAEPDSLDALLADLVSAPRNDALIGRASFRRAPIVLNEDRVVLGSDRLRLTIARRR